LMEKVLALASVGAFLLSLTGALLAQEEEPTAATPPAAEKATPATPGALAMEAPAAPKSEAAKEDQGGQAPKGKISHKAQKTENGGRGTEGSIAGSTFLRLRAGIRHARGTNSGRQFSDSGQGRT